MMIASSICLLGREDWFFLGEIRCLDGSLSGGMLKQFLPPCSTLDGETSGYVGRFILQSALISASTVAEGDRPLV